MKKIYLILLSMLLVSSAAFAQKVPIFTENFPSKASFDANWTVRNTGGNAWDWSEVSGAGAPGGQGDNTKVIVSRHATDANDAWLISPGITLTAGVEYSLSFYKRTTGVNATSTASALEVKIGTNKDDFSSNTALWTNSGTGTSLGKQTINSFIPATTGVYYIAFHSSFTSGSASNYVLVDAVTLEGPANNNLTLTPGFPYPYRQIPVSQKAIFAQVKNAGQNPQTNVVFSANLNATGAVSAAPIASLAVDATSDFSLTSGILFNGGANTVVYTVTQTETDDAPADNTATHTFTGTSIIYATDNEASIDPASNNTASFSKTTGNIYKITDQVTLVGVTAGFGFHGAYSLTPTIALYRLSGNLTVEATPIFTKQVTRPAEGGIYTFSLDAPVTLTPGDYFLAFEYTGSDIGPARYSVTPSNFYVKDGTALTVSAVQNSGLVLRLVLQSEEGCTVTPVPATPVPGNYSAVLSWESAPVYQYKVVLTYGGNSHEYITANKTITIDGLPSGGNFTWTVTAMCDLTTESTPVAGAPFSTLPCAEFVSEGFNGTFPPSECWISTSTNNTPWKQVSEGTYPTCNPHEGTGMIQYNAYAGSYNNQRGVLITPPFTHTGHLELSFWLYRDNGYASNTEKVNIYLSEISDITGLTPIKTFSRSRTQDPIEAADGWYQYHVTLSGDAGKKYYVAIEGVGANGNNIYLDEIAVGDYVDVADAGVTAITTPVSGINLGESTVTVKVRNYGTSELTNVPVSYQVNSGAVVTETVAAIPYNGEATYVFTQKANLSATSTTTFTIKAFTKQPADANLANDTIAISVTSTICSPVTTLPWTESFETNNGSAIPYQPTPCWLATENHPSGQTLPTYWDRQTTGGNPNCSPQDGSAMLRFYCFNFKKESKGVLYTPPLVLGNKDTELSFWMYRDSGYPNDQDSVNIYLSETPDITGLTPVKTIYRLFSLAPAETTANQWYQYKVAIPQSGWENTYIALEAVSQYGSNIYVDNLKVSISYTTLPAAGTENVSLASPLQVNFTEAIEGLAVVANAKNLITVKENGTGNTIAIYSVTVSDSKSITIDHRDQAFTPEKTYTVTIPAGVITGYDRAISWSFTTAVAVTAVSTYPENNATGFGLDEVAYIQFSKAIAGSSLAGITINNEPITPVLANGGSYGLNSRLRFTHSADYQHGTLYTIKVPAAAILNYTGGDIELKFTTDVALDYTTTPTDKATGVALDAEIKVVFNKNIFTWGGFGNRPVVTITAVGGSNVTGVNFVDITPLGNPTNTVVINHDAFALDTEYAVTVPADVVGAYSFITQEPIKWTFRTLKGTDIKSLSASGKVYAANKQLHISGYPAGSLVAVYNVVGEAAASRRVASDNTTIELNSGVYVVKVQVEGNIYIHKVLVK